MFDTMDAVAWTSLLLGLFALAACISEFRRPGHWYKMLQEISDSPAHQLNVGLLELLLGALVYIVNPWNPQDGLAMLMKILGGLMMIEALVTLAFADLYMGFWARKLGPNMRGWAIVALLFGVGLTLAGLSRFL